MFLSVFLCTFAQAENLYLIVYKEQNLKKLQSLKGKNLNQYLRNQTRVNERQLFSNSRAQISDKKSLWILNATLIRASSSQAQTFYQFSNVAGILPMGKTIRLSVGNFEPLAKDNSLYTYGLVKIGLPQLRTQYVGLEGRGVRVGVIDTGILLRHPDFENRIIKFRDFVNSRPLAYDDHGHGTHVAGTVAGSNKSGRWIGVAPGAELIIAKSFNSRGNTVDADLLLSLQWMADPDNNPETDDGAHIVNNSWNTEEPTLKRDPALDPFCAIIPRLKALNVLPVFAAGNDGPRENTLTPPAACPDSLSVGATDQDDRIADFSSRGPVKWVNQMVNKPDLSAPGKGVNSADLGSQYRTRSGTSMASPHVAGALAIFKQLRPDLNASQLESLIKLSVQDLGPTGFDYQYGFGRLDLMKGIQFLEQQ